MPAQAPEAQGGRAPSAPLALDLRGVSKRFGAVQANDAVDFAVRPGEIRGLVGENGAGKSTLMAIASGLYAPDAGEIWVGGERRRLGSTEDAIALGINMVHQQFMLVDDCTVAQNVVLGQPGGPVLKMREVEAGVAELGERYGIEVEPRARVGSLTPTERQRIEILAALWRGRTVLILDEPTSVLAPADIAQLFTTMRRLAGEGCSVVFTSHKLREVIEVCDSISVMRRGKLVTTVPREEVDAEGLATLMVGKRLTEAADSSLVGLEDSEGAAAAA
ncbi:MAG: ATP-binding cassette domain-containing protein, partial [Actinobacteria bacterium]|nr:ATP-binding cassette domain-containing protein [Actinomycetota bacterium]